MPPVDPDSVPLGVYDSWPGIDASGHVSVDRARLRALTRRLENHLEDMLSAHEDLRPADAAAYGAWDAAQQFYPSVRDGHETLLDQHSRFLHAVMDMIKKLHRSAQNYDEAESDLERRIAEIDKRMNVATTSDLGGHGSAPHHSSRQSVPNALNPDGRA